MTKISAILSALLIFSLFLCSCSEDIILYEHTDRIEVAERLGNYLFDELKNKEIDIEEWVNAEPHSEQYIIKDEQLKEDFAENFAWAVFIYEHTILIYDEAVFQSCFGYLVTDGKKYDNGDLYVGYGFDGGKINLSQTSTDNVYHFDTGL